MSCFTLYSKPQIKLNSPQQLLACPHAIQINIFTVAYCNLQSLGTKFDQLLYFANSVRPSIMCIAKINLNHSKVAIQGCMPFRKDLLWNNSLKYWGGGLIPHKSFKGKNVDCALKNSFYFIICHNINNNRKKIIMLVKLTEKNQ